MSVVKIRIGPPAAEHALGALAAAIARGLLFPFGFENPSDFDAREAGLNGDLGDVRSVVGSDVPCRFTCGMDIRLVHQALKLSRAHTYFEKKSRERNEYAEYRAIHRHFEGLAHCGTRMKCIEK